MRLSAAETQLNNNTNVNFSGNKGTKFISDKHFAWMENIDGAQQRAIMGATALVLQPPIDYFNPMADEKTRKYSLMKTIVKVLVGTAVGVSVRAIGIKYAKYLTRDQKAVDKLTNRIKDPQVAEKLKDIMQKDYKRPKFIKNLGTMLGVVAVTLSNFTIDMPLAKFAIGKASEKMNLSADKPKEDKR